MNKAQLQASLAFNGETLAEAENTLRRIQAEPYPQRPYFQERLNAALRLVYEIKSLQCRMQEELAALTPHPSPIHF